MNEEKVDLKKFFNPKSVPIVGVSSDFSKFTGRTLKHLLKHSYNRKVYTTNPKYKEIAGFQFYSSISYGAAFWVANEALQIMGGYGYSTEFPIEYVLRRVRGWTIGGGNDRDDEKPDRRRDLRQTFQPETPKTFMRSFLNTCTRRAEQ